MTPQEETAIAAQVWSIPADQRSDTYPLLAAPFADALLTQVREDKKPDSFATDLRDLINHHSRENRSNTPDSILAGYLDACLSAFDTAVQQRETWYGRDGSPHTTTPQDVPDDGEQDSGGSDGDAGRMTKSRALGYAAQAWCTPATESREMDPALAAAFADILLFRVGQTVSVADARVRIQAAFDADPSFRDVYVSNIAMRLYDAFYHHPEIYGKHNPFADYAARNDLASSIVDLVFKG